jgi:hypothetical protein
LRTLFLADLLARPLDKERYTGSLLDRTGVARVVFDIDGTRQAARQRAEPVTEELPPPQRRLTQVCAPGYTGRKRGEIVRTRTVVSQAHSYHWLGSFGNRGNGLYRKELRRGLSAIRRYLEAEHLSPTSALLRLDGQYGTGAVITDLADFPFVMRGKDYTVLDRESVQSRLHLPADQQFSRSESDLVRQLYDCPDVPVGPEGVRCRVVVATHPATSKKSRIGHTRKARCLRTLFHSSPARGVHRLRCGGPLRGLVAPLNRCLPMKTRSKILTAGVRMPRLDKKPGRLSHNGSGTRLLELGHTLEPTPLRTTEFAPALTEATAEQAPVQGYEKPAVALPWKAERFSGQDFALQPDGTLACPAGKTLRPTEQRQETDGSLRVLYSARIRDCRGCPKRAQCQWNGEATSKPRRISILLHPLRGGPAPLLWRDWSRREQRQACMQLVRHQRIEVSPPPATVASPRKAEEVLSRAQRAHTRLSWQERLARNALAPTAGPIMIKLFGIPESFAASLGLATA